MGDAPLTKQYFDEQFDFLGRAVKGGFDHVDERFKRVDERFDAVDERFGGIEKDVAYIKQRLAALEDEVQALSRNMITKQYLDAKLDIFIRNQERDSLFKRTLLLMLEQSKVLDPASRAKLEQLIPS